MPGKVAVEEIDMESRFDLEHVLRRALDGELREEAKHGGQARQRIGMRRSHLGEACFEAGTDKLTNGFQNLILGGEIAVQRTAGNAARISSSARLSGLLA